jgi:hypothetical protein
MSKEKMLEFIRNAIIIANNPECKTLEEALKKESANQNCMFAYNPCQIVELSGASIVDAATGENKIYTEGNLDKIKSLFYRSVKTDKLRQKSQIKIIKNLGLPITLERLLICLNRTQALCGQFYSDGIYIFQKDEDFEIEFKLIIENDEETIQKIAEILGYKN